MGLHGQLAKSQSQPQARGAGFALLAGVASGLFVHNNRLTGESAATMGTDRDASFTQITGPW